MVRSLFTCYFVKYEPQLNTFFVLMGMYKVEKYLIFCYMVTYLGTVEVLSYPSLRPLDTLTAHTAGCYCIAIDPTGRYVASVCYFCSRKFHFSFKQRKERSHDRTLRTLQFPLELARYKTNAQLHIKI